MSLLACFAVLVLMYKNTMSESGLFSSAGYGITDFNAILFLVVLSITGVSFFVAFLLDQSNRRKIKERLIDLASQEHGLFEGAGSVTALEYLNISSNTLKENEFTGIYILHNERKDKYYIGQSVRTLDRIRQHLTGHGNGDVYADFKYGDPFTVRTIPLANSGYQSLNDLEREAIEAYGAYTHGYNGTRGNSR